MKVEEDLKAEVGEDCKRKRAFYRGTKCVSRANHEWGCCYTTWNLGYGQRATGKMVSRMVGLKAENVELPGKIKRKKNVRVGPGVRDLTINMWISRVFFYYY